MFNPVELARKNVMACVTRHPCHFSLVVESVRLSDVGRLVGGYRVFGDLVKEGKLVLSDKGVLSLPE